MSPLWLSLRSEPGGRMGDRLLTAQEAGPMLADASAQAVRRMMRDGVACRNGNRVYLRYATVGRRSMTRQAWVDQFIEEVADNNAVTRDETRAPSLRMTRSALEQEGVA